MPIADTATQLRLDARDLATDVVGQSAGAGVIGGDAVAVHDAAGGIEHDELGEGAADVDPDGRAGHALTHHPPSTASTWPVTNRDSGESRYTTAPSTSSGRPMRPPSSGCLCAM